MQAAAVQGKTMPRLPPIRPLSRVRAFTLVALATTLGLALIALWVVEERLLARTGETLALAAADIADKLDLVLDERAGDLRALARSGAPLLEHGELRGLSTLLASVRQAFPLYLWLGVTDRTGRIVAATEATSLGADWSEAPWVQAVRDGAPSSVSVQPPSDASPSRSGWSVQFTVPVLGRDDHFLGTLTTRVGLSALEELFPRTVRTLVAQGAISFPVEWVFLGPDGIVLNESWRLANQRVNLLELGVPSAQLALDRQAPPGYVQETHGHRSVPVMTGYAHTQSDGRVPSLLLGVLVRANREALLAPIRATLWKLAAAGALLSLPLLGMLWWGLRRLERAGRHVAEAGRSARESESRLRATFEQAAVGMALVALSGRWLRVNQKLCEIVGYTRDELLARRFQDITHPDDLEGDLDHVRDLLDGKATTYSIEKRYLRKDGSPVWVNLTVSLVRDAAGQPDYFVSIIEDISARKRAEAEVKRLTAELEHQIDKRTAALQAAVASLEEARAMLDLIINTIPQHVFWKDRQSRYLGCNRLFAQAAGVGEPAAIVGKTDFDLAWRDTAERYHADDREVMEHSRPKLNYEEPQTRPDGSLRWLRTSKVPLTHPDGTVFGILGLYEDITEQKELEAKAGRLERLVMLGQLLGGVAHEIKNPLFILTGYIQLLKEKLQASAGADLLADFQKIEDAARRMVKITERFLQLARGTPPHEAWVSVDAVLRATLEFLANELMRNQIRAVTEIPAALPPVWADPGRLQEVFLNLLLNAIQAMAAAHGKGTLTVSAKLAASSERPAASEETLSAASYSGSAPEPSWIEVRIQDDGPGIPPEHQARLFEPFFSTKAPEEGSGLGLWIVRSNLVAMGGTVWCESTVGQGATFIVRLPVARESRQPSAVSDRNCQ